MQLSGYISILYITGYILNGEAAITCNIGTQDAVTKTDYQAGTCVTVTVCSKPKFEDYTTTGFVNVGSGSSPALYACGTCASQATTATLNIDCEECTPANDTHVCNTITKTGDDFKCYSTWTLTDGKWAANTETTKCMREEGYAIKCNYPGTAAPESYQVQKNGCGPCDGDANCEDCDEEKCSGAAALVVFLLPLLAAIYTLL